MQNLTLLLTTNPCSMLFPSLSGASGYMCQVEIKNAQKEGIFFFRTFRSDYITLMNVINKLKC